MNQEELNTAVYDKMFAEQNNFRDWLKGQSPEAVLNHAYAYTVREDILIAMENCDLTVQQAKAPLSSPTPLEDVFHDFQQIESGQTEIIQECIETRANDILQTQRESLKNTPLYPYSASEAHQRGERDAYFASRKANVACKEAIEEAIRDYYRDDHLDPCAVQQVMQVFGADRTCYVLSNTIRHKDWDERFSTSNRTWAATVPVRENRAPDGTDRNLDFVVESHSGLVDLFISQTRSELEHSKERKPSVLKKLRDAKAETQPAATKKHKEAER
jgi:hypothetical protein